VLRLRLVRSHGVPPVNWCAWYLMAASQDTCHTAAVRLTALMVLVHPRVSFAHLEATPEGSVSSCTVWSPSIDDVALSSNWPRMNSATCERACGVDARVSQDE
jgi:hypothetical protein